MRPPAGSAKLTPARGVACLLLLLMGLPASLHAAEDPIAEDPVAEDPVAEVRQSEQEFRLVPAGTIPLKLTHGFVHAPSVRVFVEGVRWEPDVDYRVRARTGLLIPVRNWVTAGTDSAATPDRALVMVSYDFLPVPLPPRRDLRPVAAPPDQSGGPVSQGLFNPADPANEWSAGNLQVSGSKTVQVSSGSRREMTVDQNLRLTIMGQLTPDIAVRAFLSDDNLPVVPEGNTEELRDIDKVLVELTAPTWAATLGDFVARRQGTTFGNYRRKLQGFSLQATPGPTEFEVLAGSPRGLYRTLQIRGQEANQGPYYLGGSGSAGNLFIVAGSERVTLDGQELIRGSDRDYVIDYVVGTVTFTYRQLITAESTIVVEFEEGEGPYGRTVVGGGAGVKFKVPLVDLPGRVSARVIRERDDPSRLRTGVLGDDDEAILRAAGDDLTLAVAGGVSAAVPGEGQYDEQVVGPETIYIYNELGGNFDVAFFYVGPGVGDYNLDRLTNTGQQVFLHVGAKQGAYLIGRPLPMPGQQSVATFTADVGDTAGSFLGAEWNAGVMDLNQLSELDNDDNNGGAGRVEGRLRGQGVSLGDRNLGQIDLEGSWEQKDGEFKPFQVHKTIFDYDQWGLDDRARRAGFLDESERESRLAGSWRTNSEGDRVQLAGKLGSLRHGNALAAEQIEGRADWELWGGRGRHLLQKAQADDVADPLEIRRTRRTHEVSWNVGPLVPSVNHKLRRWQDGKITGNRAAGYQLEEYGAGLAARAGGSLAWNVNFARGLADSLLNNEWQRQRDSRTTRGGISTGRFAGMRLVGEGTLRQVLQPGGPDETTRLGRVNLAGTWDRTASDWSLGYRVENSRAEVLDRQIVFVGDGQGEFNEDGLFVGPGQGDHDMILVGTDSLVATTGVVADLNYRQGFKFLGEQRWYGAWSAMTLASMGGRSTTDDVGGLLTLDPNVIFDKKTAVLGDLNFSEELVFLKHLRTVDLRAKFAYRETVDRQFADHPEDRTDRIWQMTGNINVSRRSALKLRWQRQDDRRYTAEGTQSARRSLLILSRRYEVGWNYSPTTDLRLGLQAEYIERRDNISGVDQKEIALRPTGRARLRKAWTLQGDLRFANVDSAEPVGAVRPFFFPLPGRNVESSLRLAWDPSGLLSVAASWFTQKREDRRWQHNVRLETTARF